MRVVLLGDVDREQGGVYQYAQTLAESLCQFSKHELFIVKDKKDDFLKDFYGKKVLNVERSRMGVVGGIKKLLAIILPKFRRILHLSTRYDQIKGLNPQLVISPGILLAPLYFDYPYITTIHDLQHKYYPHFFSWKERLARDLIYTVVARNASLVVCESTSVRDDVVKFLGVPASKVCIIPSPPPLYMTSLQIDQDRLNIVRNKYKLPEKFLFYPAQFWVHKNHLKLVQAIKAAANSSGVKVNLVLVGAKKENFVNVTSEIEALKLESQIHYLGYVPQEDMPYLYKLSTALIVPTLFESLSIPIWEAFHLGVPVVCSNVCALPEQVGDAALLFNPQEVEEMAQQISQIWGSQALREELVQKGYKRIKDMSLENYAMQWQEAIKSV